MDLDEGKKSKPEGLEGKSVELTNDVEASPFGANPKAIRSLTTNLGSLYLKNLSSSNSCSQPPEETPNEANQHLPSQCNKNLESPATEDELNSAYQSDEQLSIVLTTVTSVHDFAFSSENDMDHFGSAENADTMMTEKEITLEDIFPESEASETNEPDDIAEEHSEASRFNEPFMCLEAYTIDNNNEEISSDEYQLKTVTAQMFLDYSSEDVEMTEAEGNAHCAYNDPKEIIETEDDENDNPLNLEVPLYDEDLQPKTLPTEMSPELSIRDENSLEQSNTEDDSCVISGEMNASICLSVEEGRQVISDGEGKTTMNSMSFTSGTDEENAVQYLLTSDCDVSEFFPLARSKGETCNNISKSGETNSLLTTENNDQDLDLYIVYEKINKKVSNDSLNEISSTSSNPSNEIPSHNTYTSLTDSHTLYPRPFYTANKPPIPSDNFSTKNYPSDYIMPHSLPCRSSYSASPLSAENMTMHPTTYSPASSRSFMTNQNSYSTNDYESKSIAPYPTLSPAHHSFRGNASESNRSSNTSRTYDYNSRNSESSYGVIPNYPPSVTLLNDSPTHTVTRSRTKNITFGNQQYTAPNRSHFAKSSVNRTTNLSAGHLLAKTINAQAQLVVAILGTSYKAKRYYVHKKPKLGNYNGVPTLYVDKGKKNQSYSSPPKVIINPQITKRRNHRVSPYQRMEKMKLNRSAPSSETHLQSGSTSRSNENYAEENSMAIPATIPEEDMNDMYDNSSPLFIPFDMDEMDDNAENTPITSTRDDNVAEKRLLEFYETL